MNNPTTTLGQRYSENHTHILQLKEQIGKGFWTLGHQLMRMQRECAQCGELPFHDDFVGNNKKSVCPKCGSSELGLYRQEHETFNAYLQHVRINKQTAYRKIGIYETYHGLLPVIAKLAPNSDQTDAAADAQSWAQEYLINIGWTVLEAIQSRVVNEEDESKILRIIQEAESTPRERLGKTPICVEVPHKQELGELRAKLNLIQRSLQTSHIEEACESALELSQLSRDLADLLQEENEICAEADVNA